MTLDQKAAQLLGVAEDKLRVALIISQVEVCTRCGGTGEYSFNYRDGTRCFKCGGSKYLAPKVSKRIYAELEQLVESGTWQERLEAHNLRARNRKIAENADKTFRKAQDAAGIGKLYGEQYDKFRSGEIEEIDPKIFAAQKRSNAISSKISNLGSALNYRDKSKRSTPEQVIEALEKGLAELEEIRKSVFS